jgi:methylenetetrahydrofolate dehydrogenase (NADP+)/methenyltetrahydrofolate cyclohydrolase
MKIIDGKETAKQIKMEIAAEVADLIDNKDKDPHLAAILVGEDPASQTYVRNKEKSCSEVGILSSIYRYPSDITERELLDAIEYINNDDEIDGLIVQLPLPDHISDKKIIESINPAKDVDGFHPMNVGKMMLGLPTYLPATPFGIIQLLERYNIETEGKHCVILGRSHIVGSPISVLLSRKANPGNCTVTLCHSKTKNIKKIAKSADILIVAMGQPKFVTHEMVKKGAVVIDVGIHRVPSDETKSGFRLVGDVDFEKVAGVASYITPVPGGVGPMTIVSLLQNTVKAAKKEVYS